MVTILYHVDLKSGSLPNPPNNNLHIVILVSDNEKGTCLLIDITISAYRNVIKSEAEKIFKYKDFTVEIQRMWKLKTKVTQVR
jgi:hypothetical protein